jgi:hypothetical protein
LLAQGEHKISIDNRATLVYGRSARRHLAAVSAKLFRGANLCLSITHDKDPRRERPPK